MLENSLSGASGSDAVELANLLDDIYRFTRRFVVLTQDQLIAIALWVVHTHAGDAADQTPYLHVNSPAPQCGKSRLLEVLELITYMPQQWARPSEAVVYRYIEMVGCPTLLLDEVDAIWNEMGNENEGLRALINAGNRRGAVVPRCVGPTQQLGLFKVFCPKVLAGIGRLPDTIADRSIPISMKRKTRDEYIERFRRRLVEEDGKEIKVRLEAWGQANIETLRDAWPELPEVLSDRQQEAVEPLLAIADLAGERWAQAARTAFVNLCAVGEAADESLRLRCLADCREVFGTEDRISSATLTANLVALTDAPWMKRDLTPNTLAWHLKPYEVHPKQIRFGEQTMKGYYKKDFEDAWDRYLKPVETET